MTTRSLLVTFFLNLFSHPAVYHSIPKYEQVVTEFFALYDLPAGQDYHDIRFVKKSEGYFVEEYDRKSEKYKKPQLFWSDKEGEYKKLKFPKNSYYEKDIVDIFLNNWNAPFFDSYPYYGYVNWELDVIDFFNNNGYLTPDDQYYLGRAYSSYASNLINNNSSFADKSTMFEIEDYGSNQLNSDDLEKYRFYRHKAIEVFGRLNENFPYLETLVGSINTKYSNEYITSFLDLRVYQNEEEAEKELPDSIYSPFFIEMAKNYLNSCDSNAILFTNGDNDTYPLLYLQAKKNYRTDVMVVNQSLLNNNNYINHFRYGKILDADSLNFVLRPDNYSGDKQGYTVLRQRNDTVELKEALQLIRDEDRETDNLTYPDFRYLISNNFKIALDSNKSIIFKIGQDYIRKGDLMALDIIQSNITTRPVNFVYNTSLGLTENMEISGFVFKLVNSVDRSVEYQVFGGIDASKTYNQMMYNFKLGEANDAIPAVLYSYQRSFCRLAKYFADAEQRDSCKIVIDKYCALIPDSVFEMDYNMLTMVKSAYRVDLTEEGDLIASAIINNMNKKTGKYKFSERDRSEVDFTLDELKKIINNKELLTSIEEIEEKI